LGPDRCRFIGNHDDGAGNPIAYRDLSAAIMTTPAPPSHVAASPEELVSAREESQEPAHDSSLTAVATEAAQTGVADSAALRGEFPGQDDLLMAGDPDIDPLSNEYSGEEVPGSSTPTPDQNNVDDIGRAYGLTNLDDGALVSADDLVRRRDAHRWELDPRSKDPEP